MNPFTRPLGQVCPPPPCPYAVLRRSLGLVSPPHRRAVLLLRGGGRRPGAAVRRRAAAGRDESVLEGQGEGQGRVGRPRQGVPVPVRRSQHSRRSEGERQRKSSHVKKPAHASRHLGEGGGGGERSVFAVRDELRNKNCTRREKRGCSVRGWLLVGTQLRLDSVQTRHLKHTPLHTHTHTHARAGLWCVYLRADLERGPQF